MPQTTMPIRFSIIEHDPSTTFGECGADQEDQDDEEEQDDD